VARFQPGQRPAPQVRLQLRVVKVLFHSYADETSNLEVKMRVKFGKAPNAPEWFRDFRFSARQVEQKQVNVDAVVVAFDSADGLLMEAVCPYLRVLLRRA
jgi:hypothetical protein